MNKTLIRKAALSIVKRKITVFPTFADEGIACFEVGLRNQSLNSALYLEIPMDEINREARKLERDMKRLGEKYNENI